MMDEFDRELVARAEGWRRDIAGDDPVKKELYRFVGLIQMGVAMVVLNRIGDNDIRGTGTAGALIACPALGEEDDPV